MTTGFRFGMPTLVELPDLEANVEVCRQLGLSFIELNMNLPEFLPEALGADKLKSVREKTGIDFTLHLPEELDLAAFSHPTRQGHLKCCLEALAWAAEAGITIVNMHLNYGVYFTLPDRKVWLYEKHFDEFLSNLRASFRELLADERSSGVTICLENAGVMFQTEFGREAISSILALSDRIGLTWDIGHDAASGYGARPLFESMTDRIAHVHLHDSDGSNSHQVLFTGAVDVAGTVELAKRLGVAVVIEVKTVESLTESVKQLDERAMRTG